MKKRILILALAMVVACAGVLIARRARLPVYKGGGVLVCLVPTSYEEMVSGTEYYSHIFTGKVVKKEPREGSKRAPDHILKYCYSLVTVQVDEVIKGEVGKTFLYHEDGGTSKEGWVYRVDYSRTVEVGDEVLIVAGKERTALTYENIFPIQDGMVNLKQEDLPWELLQDLTDAGLKIYYPQLPVDVYLELLRLGFEGESYHELEKPAAAQLQVLFETHEPEPELEPMPEPEPESDPQPEPEPESGFAALDFTQVEKVEFLYSTETGTFGMPVETSLAGEIGELLIGALEHTDADAGAARDAGVVLTFRGASRLLVNYKAAPDGYYLGLYLMDGENVLAESRQVFVPGEDPFAELFDAWKP